jgi:hypothetical protein
MLTMQSDFVNDLQGEHGAAEQNVEFYFTVVLKLDF